MANQKFDHKSNSREEKLQQDDKNDARNDDRKSSGVLRTWGLMTFFGLVLLILATYYLVAPTIIKNGIETAGSEALGAKVELGAVELKLNPISVSLKNFAAADPEFPMQNLLEAEQVNVSIDAPSLLWKKVVIDTLTIEGVKTATKRKTSGELAGGRKSQKLIDTVTNFELPSVSEDDMRKMVDESDLITMKRVRALEASQKRIQTEWEQALDQKALQGRVDQIKQEFDRLSERAKKNKMNLLADRKDWKKLKKSIQAEQKALAGLSDKMKVDKKEIKDKWQGVKNGPRDDVNKMLADVGVNQDMQAMAEKYLGPKFKPWVDKVLGSTAGIAPTESENNNVISKGNTVYFRDHIKLPDFLIKDLKISGEHSHWKLKGDGNHLGYFPWLVGKPAQFNLDFSGNGSAKLVVDSHWKSEKEMQTDINSTVKAWLVTDIPLVQMPEGNWRLKTGELNASIKGKITLESVDINASFRLAKIKLEMPENTVDWQKSVAQAVESEPFMKVDIKVTGSIDSPKIEMKSSLEKILKSVIGDKVKQEAKKLTGDLESKISSKVGDLSQLEAFSGNFKNWESSLGENQNLLDGILGKIKL